MVRHGRQGQAKKTAKTTGPKHQRASLARFARSLRSPRRWGSLQAQQSPAKPSEAQRSPAKPKVLKNAWKYVKMLKNPSQNPPKTLPKPSPKPPQTQQKSNFLLNTLWGYFVARFWSLQSLPNPSKTLPKPPQIDQKTMSKNTWFFKASHYRFFSIFHLKIRRFFDSFSMPFAIMYEKLDFVKIELSPRREHDF